MKTPTASRSSLAPLATAWPLGFALWLSACAVTPGAQTREPVAVDAPASVVDGERHLEYRVARNIRASPENIWALLTTAEAYPSWNSTVISIDGNIAPGASIVLRSTVDPKRKFKLTVTTFDAPRKLVWEDGGKAFRGVRTFTLSPRDDGSTDVTMVEALGGTMMGMIESKLPDFRPSFDTFMNDLEVAAEAAG